MRVPYRLGLDIGTNSIGWAVLDLNGSGEIFDIRAMGSRIFSNGRNPDGKATLASQRRAARLERRQRDRYLRRRTVLMNTLVRFGLMPESKSEAKRLERLDPYELRARGLDEALDPFALGRAIFHLNQRRGFKSNRKTDSGEDGLIKSGIQALDLELARSNARTLGEYLHKRIGANMTARARPEAEGSNKSYPFYPSRQNVEDEFEALWQAQTHFHPTLLTQEAHDAIHRVIFFQRPLKPVDPGKCTFLDGEKRAPHAHPLFQRYRILTELAILRIIEDEHNQRPLTMGERDLLLREMMGENKDRKPKKALTFQRIRKLLDLDPDAMFSLEDARRTDIAGDLTGAALTAKGRLDRLKWAQMDAEARAELVDKLLHTEEEDELLAWLEDVLGLDQETARLLAEKTTLPSGHGRLSLRALELIVPVLEKQSRQDEYGTERPIRYDEACQVLGWHHSDRGTGAGFGLMPYYGEVLYKSTVDAPKTVEPEAAKYGWITNPTVHIGLNQLRLIVNKLIERYGPPHEIMVELSRDLKTSKKKKDEIKKEQAQNATKNKRWREELETEFGIPHPSHKDMMKMRLYDEMPAGYKVCVFSGRMISRHQLLSDEIEIEHIIPFSRSLDDSFMNKVLCFRDVNRKKANRTPWKEFARTDGWDEIIERARLLSRSKFKRFLPDYLKQDQDFLARHLNDGRYLCRVAKDYLSCVCKSDNIWVVPGQLTAMLRGKWGLHDPLNHGNVKNREDHRHHAIDAFVVACTSRSMLNRLSRAAGLAEEENRDSIVNDMPPPFERFDREAIIARLRKIVVSHRPDHSFAGQMNKKTAYGLVSPPDKQGRRRVVHRKALTAFEKSAQLDAVAAPKMRAYLKELAGGADGKELQRRLAQAVDSLGRPIRAVRIEETLSVIPIADKEGKDYKGLKGDSNWRYEIRMNDKGKWFGASVSTFDAYRRKDQTEPEDLVMCLYKNDLISIKDPDDPSQRRILRVVKFSGNVICTADHYESGPLKARDDDKDGPFQYLERSAGWYRQHDIKNAGIDPLGFGASKSRIKTPKPKPEPELIAGD